MNERSCNISARSVVTRAGITDSAIGTESACNKSFSSSAVGFVASSSRHQKLAFLPLADQQPSS